MTKDQEFIIKGLMRFKENEVLPSQIIFPVGGKNVYISIRDLIKLAELSLKRSGL